MLDSATKVVPSGYGDGNIKEIITELNKRDGDVVLSIEPHLKVFAGYDAPVMTQVLETLSLYINLAMKPSMQLVMH